MNITETAPNRAKIVKQAQRGLGVAKQRRVEELCKSIPVHHEAVSALLKTSMEKFNEAVAERLLLGQELLELKELVPFGMFGPVIQGICPRLSERTAQRTMQLARTAKDKGVSLEQICSAKGIYEAYELAGIDTCQKPKPSVQTPVTVEASLPVIEAETTVEPAAAATEPTARTAEPVILPLSVPAGASFDDRERAAAEAALLDLLSYKSREWFSELVERFMAEWTAFQAKAVA